MNENILLVIPSFEDCLFIPIPACQQQRLQRLILTYSTFGMCSDEG